MEIKVLGTGCANCKALLSRVEQVVSELGLDTQVSMVDDILEIIEYKVRGLPTLVIDERVVSVGTVLSKDEIRKIITQ